MTIKEQLRSNFPNIINKTMPVFTSLVASDDGTAVLEKHLTDLIDYMAGWRNIKNVYDTRGTALEYTAKFFTYLERFLDEKETSYLDRIRAIFVRGHDLVWGTPNNVIHTFKEYFGIDTVYLVENTRDKSDNLITNYDFDNLDDWTDSNVTLSYDACFLKQYGVLFGNGGGYITQDVTVTEGSGYWLHCFYKGNITLEVTGGHSFEWSVNDEQYESVAAKETESSEDWKDIGLFFVADGNSVTIKISGDEDTCCDYPRLFLKQGSPSFTVMVQFVGDSSKNALALAPGKDDPTSPAINYGIAGYYDQDFLTGANSGYALDLYMELLGYVKAVGVTAYLEIVNKNLSQNS